MTCAKKEMRPLLLLAMVSPLFYWLSSGQNGFLQPICGIQEAVFLCSFLLLDADQPFHNLTRGVQRADLQQ